jgi:transcriptional regulator with XRE-family HTH domain
VNIKKIIGANVRGFRRKQKWTQERLAMRSKLSVEFVGRLERGLMNVSAESMVLIARALKVEVYKFFIEDSYKE